ncbi:hypothetical protein T439DRAFT_298370 [Meredithblackwellia eburnea MCA 4105]
MTSRGIQQQNVGSVFKQPTPTATAGSSFATASISLKQATSSPFQFNSTQNSYPQLCKVVLARRLKNMMLLTSFAAFLTLFLAVLDPKELPGSLFNFLEVALFTPMALLGAIPVFVLRKKTLTTALPTRLTVFSRLKLLSHPSSLPIFLAYYTGAAPLFLAYVWCAHQVSTDPRLGVMFLHKGRDAWQLNERRIYLTLLHLSIAFVNSVQHIAWHRSKVEFDSDAKLAIPDRLRSRATLRLPALLRNVGIINVAFFISYVTLRRTILRVLVINFAGKWARPALYSLVKRNDAISLSLPLRALASSFLTMTVWEVAHLCFDVYATQQMVVSQFAPKPNQCLISGLRAEDSYFQHFAYLELSVLSLTDAARRKSIFTEIGKEGAMTGAWNDISREALKLVGTELLRANGKGNVPNPSTALSPSTVQATPSKLISGSPIKNENVFRPAKKTFIDSLLSAPSSASTTPKPAAASSAISASSSITTSRVPSIFQTSQTSAVSASVATTPGKLAGSAKSTPLEARILQKIPKAWRTSVILEIFAPNTALIVGRCVARRREVVWAVEGISNMICASLSEDAYGVAQRDIPKVLEAFVLYLFALEEAAKGIVETSQEKDATTSALETIMGPVEGALKDGVRAILTEFSPYFDAFAFPPRIAAKLQLLLDWG